MYILVLGLMKLLKQANSENCGPPLDNKFDLEVGQRSLSRSRHGTIRKVLSQRTHMPSIKALSVIVQKLWPRLVFVTDRRMRLNVPTLLRKRGTITNMTHTFESLLTSMHLYFKPEKHVYI